MADKKAIATLATTAFSGIKILSIEYDIEDKIKFCYWDNTNGDGRTITSVIRTDENGISYFTSNRTKYDIQDFIRVS